MLPLVKLLVPQDRYGRKALDVEHRHRVVARRTVLGAGLLSLAAACGKSAAGLPAPRPEKDHLKISVYKFPDVAPLYVGVREGIFQRAGLNVELLDAQTSEQEPDIYFGSWAGQFVNIAEGADFVFIGEAAQATPRYTGLVVSADANYRTLTDNVHPRVGIAELDGIGKLLTTTTLGLAGAQGDYVQTATPDMVGALAGHRVDSCWVIEPYITQMQIINGAKLLADTASGPTEGFPLSGYGCERKFAEANPRTVRAFQSALREAQELAAEPARLRTVYIEDIKMDQRVATLMSRPHYPVSMSATRIQRVADHMQSQGRLKNHVDVHKFLFV